MSPSLCSCAEVRPTAAELNRQIRALVARTAVWTPEALRELAELRGRWAAADAAERARGTAVVPAA